MGIQTILNLKIGFVLHAYAIQIVCMSFACVALPFVRARFALKPVPGVQIVERGSQWGAS